MRALAGESSASRAFRSTPDKGRLTMELENCVARINKNHVYVDLYIPLRLKTDGLGRIMFHYFIAEERRVNPINTLKSSS